MPAASSRGSPEKKTQLHQLGLLRVLGSEEIEHFTHAEQLVRSSRQRGDLNVVHIDMLRAGSALVAPFATRPLDEDTAHRLGRGAEEVRAIFKRLHTQPHPRLMHEGRRLLDVFQIRNKTFDVAFTEFGGVRDIHRPGFIPTGETALFLLASEDLEKRCSLLLLFESDHYLYRDNILKPQEAAPHEPPWSAPLTIAPSFLRYLITGEEQTEDYSTHFPAKRMTTSLAWEDLVLADSVMDGVGETLRKEWCFGKHLAPGLRTLFRGPAGTGKTLTGCLFSQALRRALYRIDVSHVLSKYIGETEKSLARVFEAAEEKNWILFFDEANALLGKRSEIADAHDRYADLEISYLLQRIEDFPGIVILATTSKAALDAAFVRRLQTIIDFPIPEFPERLCLWNKAFPPTVELEKKVDLRKIARAHKVTGGQIVSVVRYSALMAIQRGEKVIRLEDILRGIQRELGKASAVVEAIGKSRYQSA